MRRLRFDPGFHRGKRSQRQSRTGRRLVYARGCAWSGHGKLERLGWGRFGGVLACACSFVRKYLRAARVLSGARACARMGARARSRGHIFKTLAGAQRRDPRALPRGSLRTSPGRLDALSALPPVRQAPPQAAGPQQTHEESLQHVHTESVPRHHSELSVGYALPAAQHPEGIPCNLNRSAKVMRPPRDGK